VVGCPGEKGEGPQDFSGKRESFVRLEWEIDICEQSREGKKLNIHIYTYVYIYSLM